MAVRPLAIFATIGVVILILAGCGGGGGDAGLSAGEEATVASFRADVAFAGTDVSDYGELLDGVDAMVALAREKPDATYDDGEGTTITLRQVLSDAATDLQGPDPGLAAELDRVVATLD